MEQQESKLILITEFIEQKLRKEQELEFYLKELAELNRKIGFLRGEVDLTNTIINMIKREQVYDIKEEMIAKFQADDDARIQRAMGDVYGRVLIVLFWQPIDTAKYLGRP